MVVSAKSVLFTILTYSALATAAVIPPNDTPSSPFIGDPTARLQKGELNDKHHASVKFVSRCEDCVQEGESDVLFDLAISSTDTVCGESNIRLNDQKLPLQWDGEKAFGERYIVADLANGLGRKYLTAYCQSVCVTRPHGSIEGHAAQVLTVTFHPRITEFTDLAVKNTSGFAVSFNSINEPEILNFVNSRVEFPENGDSFGEWLEPTGSQELHLQRYQAPDIDLEADLKELQSMLDEASRLDDLIAEKDRKIRMNMFHECRYLISDLKQCETLKCFIKTSFKKLPDVYRLVKYRFGDVPTSLAGSPCNAYLERNKASNTIFDPSPWNVSELADSHNDINSTSSMRNSPQISNPSRPRISPRYFFPIMGTILVVNAIVVVFMRYCHNSLAWQRRRAELAARREERRTLHAYRRAACRYRWRQWWDNLFSTDRGNSNAGSSQHNPTQPQNRRAADFTPNPDHNMRENGGNSVGAEILGLRRAFDYVGGLVRYDNVSPESQLRQRPNQQEIRELYDRQVGTPAPSSIAPLTTIGSPRASSDLTYETDSIDTVDSLDTETVTIVSV